MSDNLHDRGARDRTRINVNEEHELRYWSEKFAVSPQELRKAVEQSGPTVDAVREWFIRQTS
jgi:hypothetical protein